MDKFVAARRHGSGSTRSLTLGLLSVTCPTQKPARTHCPVNWLADGAVTPALTDRGCLYAPAAVPRDGPIPVLRCSAFPAE